MKQKALNILVVFLLGVTMISCQKEPGNRELDQLPESGSWQKQLMELKNNNNRTKSGTDIDNISLVKYTYKGKINSEKEIPALIEQLLSEKSVMAVNMIDRGNFEILPVQPMMEKTKSMGNDDPFAFLKSQLESGIRVGMELIELEWNYKGATFYSTAIASNDLGGIIYDNIGHFIIRPKSNVGKTETPRVKTKSEPAKDYVEFKERDKAHNLYNIRVWEYDINCKSYFKGNGILYDRSLNADSYSAFGYSCVADARTISGNINTSDYHEFAWAYGYGAAVSISLSFDGFGFSTSGGGTKSTGTEVHRKSW